jgi:DNA-binding winged helix-turn-helix (wHTH) protein
MQAEQHLHFGPYRLDLETLQLWRSTHAVKLTPKALSVLCLLVTRPGQVVTKDEIFQTVWSDTVVGDDALTSCVQELRRALDGDARQPRYIETVHRRGFRFLPTITTTPPVPSSTFKVHGEEEHQTARDENGLESNVQSLESETQLSSPPLTQAPDGQPSLPTPPARRFWPRGSLILLGLLLLVGGSIVVHYLSLSLPSPQPLTPSILSQVYLHKRQYEQARVEAERTITLAPNSPRGYRTLGGILNLTGQAEQAIGMLEQALRLDPRFPLPYQAPLSWAYLMTRRYDKAIALQQKALSHNRNLLESHLILTISYSELGREEEARAEAAEVLRLSPTYSLDVVRQTWPYKDPADLERTLAALRKAGLK